MLQRIISLKNVQFIEVATLEVELLLYEILCELKVDKISTEISGPSGGQILIKTYAHRVSLVEPR